MNSKVRVLDRVYEDAKELNTSDLKEEEMNNNNSTNKNKSSS